MNTGSFRARAPKRTRGLTRGRGGNVRKAKQSGSLKVRGVLESRARARKSRDLLNESTVSKRADGHHDLGVERQTEPLAEREHEGRIREVLDTLMRRSNERDDKGRFTRGHFKTG